MSESNDHVSPMEQFNINELAGATAIILTGISGILVVIFKSRCFCKFRVGVSDKYSICMCERKPPPDSPTEEDEENKDKTIDNEKKPIKPTTTTVDRNSHELQPEPEPEALLPNKKNVDNLV